MLCYEIKLMYEQIEFHTLINGVRYRKEELNERKQAKAKQQCTLFQCAFCLFQMR